MQSMTGYGAAEGRDDDRAEGAVSWRWDVRSVNGKGLETRLRIPSGWDRCEPDWRALVAERFKRGSVTLSLTVAEEGEKGALALNRPALEAAAAAAAEAHHALIALGVPSAGVRPDGLLALRGVLSAEAETAPLAETCAPAVTAALREALDGLAAARDAEGAKIQSTLAAILDEIERLTHVAAEQAAARAQDQKARLRARVAALLEAGADQPEERLAQELALLAVKADVAEETERLKMHVAAARELIASDGPVGRKLDFLTQEFNREANTLCSKSQDSALTETGLALKVAVDQLREQAANVA